jgi:hypothetical protein
MRTQAVRGLLEERLVRWEIHAQAHNKEMYAQGVNLLKNLPKFSAALNSCALPQPLKSADPPEGRVQDCLWGR